MADGSQRWSSRNRTAIVVAVIVLGLVVVAAATGLGPTLPGTDGDAPATESPPATPEHYETIVIFRNDDIQPGWRAETRRAVDRVFVEEDVPVSLGVIPVVGGSPITDEESNALCGYLSDLRTDHPGTFEFALHGYTHERRTDFQGASEFGGSSVADQRRWLEAGTDIVRECTGERPTTFVPPFDSYDDTTVAVLEGNGYAVVSGNEDHTGDYFGEREVFVAGGVVHVPNDGDLVANWSDHAFHSPEVMRERFDRALANGTVYVQMIHYFTFTEAAKIEQLRSFIRYMKRHDVRFMTLGEFGRAYREGHLVRTEDGWRYGAAPPTNASSRLASPPAHAIDRMVLGT